MSSNNGGDAAVLETFVNEPAHISNRMAPMRTHVSESNPNEMWLLGLLQTEIRDLQEIIELARRGEVKLIDHVSYIKRSMQDIQQLMEKLDSDVPHLRHLHDMWEQLQECPILIDPEAAQQLPLDEQLGHYTLLNMQLRRINFQICAIVIPEQLNVWLKKSRTGYAIPLHLLFGDQLPELEDRVKLLNYLAYAPGGVSGLVDVEHGLIYRYAEKPSGQVFHLLLVILTFLLALGVVAAIHAQRAILDVSLPNVATLNFVLLWFALLIGVSVHQAIDTLKGKHPPIIAIGELGMLISAIHGRIILKLLLALIAFFGLAFSDVMEPTLLNALLVGFSLNSIVEVFGSSLEKRSASQVAAFKQQLGLNTPA